MQKLFLIFLSIFMITLLQAKLIDYDIKPDWLKKNNYMGLTILDSKELEFDTYKNIKFREISALAFKNNILYGLNDKSKLFKFHLDIQKDKIVGLELEDVIKLKDKKDKKLIKINRDSEGMFIVGKKLIISFEKNPRVEIYSFDGKKIRAIPINKSLRDISDYVAPNKALESLAYNKKYHLVTAPELPLKGEKYHTLYSKKKQWKFKVNGSITALEFIDKNRILVLQRDFNYFTRRRETILSIVNLSKCKKKICKEKTVAIFKSSDGWHLDNFEGLTRISKNKFLMISDDNESLFQKTLLVLFKINNL